MKTLSERLAYLLADNNVRSSNGLIQDLQDLEEKLERIKVILTSDIVAPVDRARMIEKELFGG